MNDPTATRRDVLQLGSIAVLSGLAGCSSPGSSTESSSSPSSSSPSQSSDADTATDESAYNDVYQKTVDSVVLVKTNQGQGTGFMYDESHVVTNAHVVGEASTVDVRFTEGRWSRGDVVGSDPNSDLAVISVDDVPSAATPIPFNEDGATIGEKVLAIGNPYNLSGTVTSGIVSGINRSIPAPTGFEIPDAIQTDAPVNPGNSGGPLVSVDGHVVAVINSGGGDNIGFGISAALTQRVVPQLIETGEYNHAYMGISFSNVTPAVARANGLDEPRGLLVARVSDDGPADGVLQPSSDIETVDGQRVAVGGDVILAIDDTQLKTTEDLGSYLALQTRPGDTVSLRLLRDGTEQTVEFELGTRPS